ncbi:MAG: tRNA (adenosine(37)-N6)-threonylcarbamoyltransferase complex dimerization subunit type 1 TsaB [Balneolaceae bacterium]
MILAIETATPVCSVAIWREGMEKPDERRAMGRGVHSEHLFLSVEELFRTYEMGTDDLTELLFSAGPGSYTGLRIGAAAIKGMLFGTTVPLYAAGSLEMMAAGVFTNNGLQTGGDVHTVINARREHLYHQCFHSSGTCEASTKAAVRSLGEISRELKPGDLVIGTGAERLENYGEEAIRWLGPDSVTAISMIRAWRDPRFRDWFRSENPQDLVPEYLSSGRPGAAGAG